MKPLCIELFAGLHGWGEGFIAEGWDVAGFDIYDMATVIGQPRNKDCMLAIQDVLTLEGRQFRNASCIVASPPCQEFSYMAMPWKRGKQIAAALRGAGEFPEPYTGSRTIPDLTRLFDACFRIQREACEAAGRHIPMVVENVRGAIPWVGRSQAEYGSFFLWGDVRQVGNRIYGVRSLDEPLYAPTVRGLKRNPDGTGHPQGSWFAVADSKNRGAKVPNFRFDGSGGSFQTAAVKLAGKSLNPGVGKWRGEDQFGYGDNAQGTKGDGGGWYGDYQQMKADRDSGKMRGTSSGMFSSRSDARKAASAQIAKIPFALASHIARVYKPCPLSSPFLCSRNR